MALNFQGRVVTHTNTLLDAVNPVVEKVAHTEVNPEKTRCQNFLTWWKNETGHYTALSRRSRLRLRDDGGGGDGGGGNVDEFKAGRPAGDG